MRNIIIYIKLMTIFLNIFQIEIVYGINNYTSIRYDWRWLKKYDLLVWRQNKVNSIQVTYSLIDYSNKHPPSLKHNIHQYYTGKQCILKG